MVFTTRDVCACVCGWCSVPRTGVFACLWMVFSTRDVFACVWMVFSTKDSCVHLCMDGVQHQGHMVFSTKDIYVWLCVVFSTRDRHVYLCVDGAQHQGQASTAVNLASENMQRFPADLPNGTTSINLNNNHITRLGNQSLASLQDLQILLLRRNFITNIEADTFKNVPKLTTLVLGGNQLTDFPWRHMQAQSLLTYLGLAGNRLTSLPNDTFQFLPSLKELRINHNRLTFIPEGVFGHHLSLKTVYMSENPWKCDCDFLMSYKTLPAAVTRSNPCMTCVTPQENSGLRVSSITLDCAVSSGSGETETTENDSVNQKNTKKTGFVNPETVPRKTDTMTATVTNKVTTPFIASKPLTKALSRGNRHMYNSAKRFENHERLGQTVKPTTCTILDTGRLHTDRDEVFESHFGQGSQRFLGTAKPNNLPMGSQNIGTNANYQTESLSTRPIKWLNAKLPKTTGTFDAIHSRTLVITAVLVALVGISPLIMALLKLVRTKKPKASNETEDDEIQPYSTMYLSNIAVMSPSSSAKPVQLENTYSLPADHTIVRHTYAEPDNSHSGLKAEVTALDDDQVVSVNLRGPEPVYEEAVPVKSDGFPVEETGQGLNKTTDILQARAAMNRQPADQPGQPAALPAVYEETPYEDVWNCISTAQREKEGTHEAAAIAELWGAKPSVTTSQIRRFTAHYWNPGTPNAGVGLKGGCQWEIEANKDGQQPTKPNIYDKPEVVIGRNCIDA
ncbi:hypothetical protein Bbelb_266220 [Branchiostoma belcheri]|nr:hypothetical protein Bbelb_266220 [Branchiostoma belcheri]